jgi:hypothetical protein
MLKNSMIAGALVLGSLAAPVTAAPVAGSFAIAVFGVTDAPGGDLALDDVLTMSAAVFAGGVGDFAGVSLMTPITIANVALTAGTTFSFTSPFGSFSGTVATPTVTAITPTSLTASFTASGTFTPDGALGFLDPNPKTIVTFGLTQSRESKSSSGTVAANSNGGPGPGVVPVPMSILLLGVGLLGLGAVMRKHA